MQIGEVPDFIAGCRFFIVLCNKKIAPHLSFLGPCWAIKTSYWTHDKCFDSLSQDFLHF